MKQLKKLLESVGLSEEHQELLETGIKDIVSESVEKEVNERIVIKEDELKDKYAQASEQYVKEQVEEQVSAKAKELEEKAEQDKLVFEEKMVDYVDKFFENEINENFSEETFEKIAINEALKPLFDDILGVFEKHNINISTDGEAKVKKLTQENEELKTQLAESINEKIELSTLGEQATCKLKLIEVTKDIDADIAEKVFERYGKASFQEINEKAEKYVEMLVDEKIKAENKKEEALDEGVKLEVEDKEKKSAPTVLDRATKYFSK